MRCITKLAVSNDKKNKVRSILIIIAILLSTMLLTVIGTFCYGSIRFNRENAGRQYGSFYGCYTNVTEAQIHEMQLRSEFADIGLMSFAGAVQSKKDCRLILADKTLNKLANLNQSLEKGAFPEQDNEIAAQRAFFQSMGLQNPQVGDEITLSCRKDNNSKYVNEAFIVSGVLKDAANGVDQKGYSVYVSKGYYEKHILKENRHYSAYFRLGKAVSITNESAEEVLKSLAVKCGISDKQVYVNSYYLNWELDPGKETITGGLLIAACIAIFTVIVVYNIFQVGIVQKIQEYGKLKAIGATRKQLRGIVMREGMMLAAAGIPGGLILGCIIAEISIEWLMQQADTIQQGADTIKISLISIPLLACVAVISLFTVWLALRKPMKIVSRITPVEAIRYQEKASKSTYLRKGFHSMGVKELMLASFSTNKKRRAMTICTMGLSCVLFVIIANFVGNIDNEYDARQSVEYGQFVICLDYALNDNAYPENNLDSVLKSNPLNNERIDQIRQIDGVTNVKTRDILAMKINNRLNSISVLDKDGFRHQVEGGPFRGDVNYAEAVRKDAIIYGWAHFVEMEGYSLNQDIKAVLYGGKGEADYQGPLQGAFGSCNTDWAITDETCRKLGLDHNIGFVWVDCDKRHVAAVKERLTELFADNPYIEIETYENALRVSRLSTRFMQLACYTILAIIGIIGFMNMANTIIISIITRKREFGVLQAIGMTSRQLNYILQAEGVFFTIGTVLAAAIVGIPAGYGVFRYGKGHGWIGLYTYHFPWRELMVMVLVLSVMQIILSFVLSRNVRKETLVERIRYEE